MLKPTKLELMRAWRFLMLIALALLYAAAASAKRAEPAKCDARNSQTVTFAALHASESDLFDECVAIRGFRVGDAIFQDQAAVYRFSSKHQREGRGVIGISFPEPDFDAPMEEGIFYGQLQSCLEVQAVHKRASRAANRAMRRGSDILLLHFRGFCSWNDGPSVAVDNWRSLAPIGWSRLTDESQRETLGDLQPIPPGFQHSNVVDWLVEIATAGICNSALKIGNAPGPPPFDQAELVVLDRSGKWADAIKKRCGIGRSEIATFLVSPKSSQAHKDAKLDLVMCVSTDGTNQRWPIALIDTGWGVDRPYVCQRVGLVPSSSSCTREKCTPETWQYEFKDDFLVSGFWQDDGFREPS